MSLLRTKKGLFESNKVQFLPVDAIAPNPGQPRRQFSSAELDELAESIREHGILQPLSVRRAERGYELIAGERSLRAARMAELGEVPCLVVDADASESYILALVENLQRQDLDFWDEALGLRQLISTCHLSQEEAAHKLGKSQSAIANKLRLLRLPDAVLELFRDNGFTERHARALLRLTDEASQMRAAQHVVRRKLTVAQTEAYISARLSPLADKPVNLQKPTYVIKDVRFFLNTVVRGLSLMQSAGVEAQYERRDVEDAILLTIRIPK